MRARPRRRFGKVIGGGLNVGAYGGRADVMSVVAPLGPVYQAGTLSGNPLATAAGLAALEHLDDDAYATLEATATRLADGLRGAFADAGVVAVVPRYGTLVGLFLGADAAADYDDGQAHRHRALRPLLPRHAPTAASPWRRAPTRSCSPASPTPTRSSTRSSTAARAAAAEVG